MYHSGSLHIDEQIRRPARTYLQQLCADTGCSLEYLSGAMNDRDGSGSRRSILLPWHDDDDDYY